MYIDREINGFNVRFQLWDSAGQEKYRSMVSTHLKGKLLCYSGSDIVFLVYDLTNLPSENSLEYWFKEVEAYVKHNNIIVLGNKTDEYKKKELDKEANFKNISASESEYVGKQKWKHIQISCKTSEGIT